MSLRSFIAAQVAAAVAAILILSGVTITTIAAYGLFYRWELIAETSSHPTLAFYLLIFFLVIGPVLAAAPIWLHWFSRQR